jgi:hypothetical protein
MKTFVAYLHVIKIARHLSRVAGNVSLEDTIKEKQIIKFNT